jgi:hypothetical protein
MDEEYIEEDAPYQDEEETEVENEELDGSEEGFIKGYEDRSVQKKKTTLDEDEELND